jgi:hypothetical protein
MGRIIFLSPIPRNEPQEGMLHMSKSKKNAADFDPSVSAEPDDDTLENPNLDPTPDLDDEEEFQFDTSLLPEGVTLVELAPDFVRPDGFLMVPRLNKKTGEIFPMTTTFVGILHDIVPWIDNRKKERLWFACEATANVGANYTGKDEKNQEFQKPVTPGTRIGISGSGAINALKGKKGHFIYLHWTGNKVTVKNGEMWEVKAKVSDKPVIEVKEVF